MVGPPMAENGLEMAIRATTRPHLSQRRSLARNPGRQHSELALVVRQPWIDLILAGEKTWEIRGAPTHKRCHIHLAQSGTGLLFGTVRVVKCFEIKHEDLPLHVEKHCIQDCTAVRYARVYAWVLEGAERSATPRKYTHPKGAITWVRLARDLVTRGPAAKVARVDE